MDEVQDSFPILEIPVIPPALSPLEEKKQLRSAAVDAITVTVNGKVFDGDEISQGRMARAVIAMKALEDDAVTAEEKDAASKQTTEWVLHDNTIANCTWRELNKAMAMAGAEQARLWILPYTS